MKAGDIVLARLPQAEKQPKLRPALVLCSLPPYADRLVCGISTQLQHVVRGFDEVMNTGDADFSTSGLREGSLIRLGFLSAIPESTIAGVLGRIAPQRLERLRHALAERITSGP